MPDSSSDGLGIPPFEFERFKFGALTFSEYVSFAVVVDVAVEPVVDVEADAAVDVEADAAVDAEADAAVA